MLFRYLNVFLELNINMSKPVEGKYTELKDMKVPLASQEPLTQATAAKFGWRTFLSFCIPFIWKKLSLCHKLLFLLSMILLIMTSLLKLLSTIYLKQLVNSLSKGELSYYELLGFILSLYS